jgi:hypothetical protein
MVSVPKTHPIPQLSIVVPIERDLAGFESTLISVLENQPVGCEVLVPHDGSYDDPFDLCEEVRFVVAESTRLVDLVGAAARQARGRYVHILGNGIRATCGWTDDALEHFDHFDTAVVAPVIRSATNRLVLSAGWSTTSTSICAPFAHGEETPNVESRIAAYLQASFWRRDVLRSLHRSYEGGDNLEASFVYHHLLRQAGWRTELCPTSTVECDGETIPWEGRSFKRGLRLRAIRNHFVGGGWSESITAGCLGMLSSLLHPSRMRESAGQCFAPLASSTVARQIHRDEVASCDDEGMIVSLPQKTSGARRRAA